jgi:hypothetical protein
MSILKPCPFCGLIDLMWFDEKMPDGKKWWSLGCNNINCEVLPKTIFQSTKTEAKKWWNRRSK